MMLALLAIWQATASCICQEATMHNLFTDSREHCRTVTEQGCKAKNSRGTQSCVAQKKLLQRNKQPAWCQLSRRRLGHDELHHGRTEQVQHVVSVHTFCSSTRAVASCRGSIPACYTQEKAEVTIATARARNSKIRILACPCVLLQAHHPKNQKAL